MVKIQQQVQEVCLDARFPCARTYNDRDIFEQVTVPEVGISLRQMVETGTVGAMPGNSPNYKYPDLEEDDETAHDHPDYEKLTHLDLVEKENFVDNWLDKPENYEQKEENTSTETASKEEDKPSEKTGEPVKN